MVEEMRDPNEDLKTTALVQTITELETKSREEKNEEQEKKIRYKKLKSARISIRCLE